jgi:hypothetical protein
LLSSKISLFIPPRAPTGGYLAMTLIFLVSLKPSLQTKRCIIVAKIQKNTYRIVYALFQIMLVTATCNAPRWTFYITTFPANSKTSIETKRRTIRRKVKIEHYNRTSSALFQNKLVLATYIAPWRIFCYYVISG